MRSPGGLRHARTLMTEALSKIDSMRRAMGFLSIEDTLNLAGGSIRMPDPASVLISPGVVLAEEVVLWPNVILEASNGGRLSIGAGTVLFPGVRILASGADVTVGSGVEIGEEGGFTVKAEAGARIEIGHEARLLGGGSLASSNRIGRGAQILGPIRCQNCRLGDGGSHRHPEPDERGAVLKGAGVARSIELAQGQVIQAFGLFAEGTVWSQSYFHPKGGR
jgi:acetyltransferase-like isoleucine patch superfamily enzyme